MLREHTATQEGVKSPRKGKWRGLLAVHDNAVPSWWGSRFAAVTQTWEGGVKVF